MSFDKAKEMVEGWSWMVTPKEMVRDIAQAIREAVEAEREACAMVAEAQTETLSFTVYGYEMADIIAGEIRARGGEGGEVTGDYQGEEVPHVPIYRWYGVDLATGEDITVDTRTGEVIERRRVGEGEG